jgi:nanoRNase/pAp phosphatase (c-di-AMP/oligoRNAs hydrolase)
LKQETLNPITSDDLERLRLAAGDGPLLVLPHDSPDPDALASGLALAKLCEVKWGISSDLFYCGLVARAENKAMLEILTPEWEYKDNLDDLSKYSGIALVDTQPEAGNNRLPANHPVNIVIDHHHPLRAGLSRVKYFDVRPEIGSTVSLLYQYYQAAGLEPDQRLATAMFYGLKTDTRGLARSTSPVDEETYVRLLSGVNRNLLIKVEQAGLPQDYFRALSQGLHAANVFGRSIVAYLGEMHRPDLAAELADVFIRYEKAEAVLCYGHHNGVIQLSLRTKPGSQDAGILVQKIVDGIGKAGGHGTTAGGQVLLAGQDISSMVSLLRRQFLNVMGEENDGGTSLLIPEDAEED